MSRIGLRSARPWALVLLVVVAAAGFQPFFLQALRVDRDVATRQYDDLPYKRVPGLQQICEDVRRSVPRGAKVAFRTPYPGWWEGYSFTYMRAAYLLAEYRLVPLVDDRDRAHPEVLEQVDWLLAIGSDLATEDFREVASTDGARLFRRVR